MSDGDRRFELNWVQSLAGALAAVTSAVLLSTVGVAGTLIGAALGSLAATVGSAVYTYYIRATQDRVASAGTVAVSRIGRDRSRVRRPSEDPDSGASATEEEPAEAGQDLPPARADLEDANPPAGRFTAVLAGLPWKRVVVVATGLFVTAMLVILAFELISGRAVSSYTGGSDDDRRTSIPGLGGGRQDDPADDQDDPQPTPGETPSGEPDASTVAPGQPTPTPTAETEETAVPRSTEAPGETATSGYTPSATPSPTAPAPSTPPPSP
jgi:hypothetical protein